VSEQTIVPAGVDWTGKRDAVRRALRRLSIERPDAVVTGLGVAVVGLVVGEWLLATRLVDVRAMNDLGLVSVLPALFSVAFAQLTASFVLFLATGRVRPWLLLLHVVALVLVLFGTPAVVEELPRSAVTYRHVGIAEYITDAGRIDPEIDAYFNWPGAFLLLAGLSDAAGLENLLVLARWTPVLLNLAFLAPLLVIFRAGGADSRLVWLAVWFFYSANWVGQDYLSPQGLTYFLYLVAIALILRYFVFGLPGPRTARKADRRRRVGALALAPRQRAAVMGVLIGLFAATVPSHQLTPFALVAAMTALVLARASPASRLPVLGVALIAGWMTFMATAYLAGHLAGITGEVGDVSGTVSSNVAARLTGSPEHVVVVATRLAFTALVCALAALGAVQARRNGARVRPLVALALAPVPLLALQSYGGEILLRIYLFSLPLLALLAASALYPALARGSVRGAALVAGACMILGVGALVARYGNERMDVFTRAELAAVNEVYARARPGDLLIAGSENMPWKFRAYDRYELEKVTAMPEWRALDGTRRTFDALVESVVERLNSRDRALLVMTRSQAAQVDLLESAPRGSFERLWGELRASPRVRELYANEDATLFGPARRRGSS